MQEKEIVKNINADFFIVDCKDFIFYARKVKIDGIESYSSEESILFILNIIQDSTKENRRASAEELFKDYKEAKAKAERLNNKEENKKRAMEWNSYKTKKRLLELGWIE